MPAASSWRDAWRAHQKRWCLALVLVAAGLSEDASFCVAIVRC